MCIFTYICVCFLVYIHMVSCVHIWVYIFRCRVSSHYWAPATILTFSPSSIAAHKYSPNILWIFILKIFSPTLLHHQAWIIFFGFWEKKCLGCSIPHIMQAWSDGTNLDRDGRLWKHRLRGRRRRNRRGRKRQGSKNWPGGCFSPQGFYPAIASA